jgi:hypothetical protein
MNMNAEQPVRMDVLTNGMGYEALRQPREELGLEGVTFSPNPAYRQYLLMHKVLVGRKGGRQLDGIYHSLRDEELPRYLAAAGSAAMEAALVRTEVPTRDRLTLIDEGVACWDRSLGIQQDLNAHAPDWWVDNSGPYRAALNMAVSPLFKGLVLGYIPRLLCRQVFEDCLNIAQANAVRIQLMANEGNALGVGDHVGFGYECNALLGFNRRFAGSRFVIPSFARADSGHHHSQQTHDLSLVEQERGAIKNITPIEIKASINRRDKERYKALLVRGIMHLSVNESYRLTDTLDAITDCYEGTATRQQIMVADEISARLVGMYRDYCAGESLDELATARSVTIFHDNGVVAANYPGLTLKAA